jgi:hypothetical protein
LRGRVRPRCSKASCRGTAGRETWPTSSAARDSRERAYASRHVAHFRDQLAAVATAILALFAIITAWYARRAFLKQSQEVRAIEQQVKDQQELTRISMQRICPSGLAELEAQAAVLPPGDGGVGAQVGLAQDR